MAKRDNGLCRDGPGFLKASPRRPPGVKINGGAWPKYALPNGNSPSILSKFVSRRDARDGVPEQTGIRIGASLAGHGGADAFSDASSSTSVAACRTASVADAGGVGRPGQVRSDWMLRRRKTLPRVRFGFGARALKALTLAVVLILGSVAGAVTAAAAVPSSAIIVDAKTGKTLYASNADERRHPASLTKMMTLYLLFTAIQSGKTTLDSEMPVSAHAAGQSPSKLGFRPGDTISVRDAIEAIVTKSANDVAVVIAEYLGGTEKAFAAQMTARAHAMGMTKSNFVNASGLPASQQWTSARDMATLGRALREHFPQFYSYFSTPSFVWQGRRIANHDNLLNRIDGVDGIKTGYTRASGFNLVSSVSTGGRLVVGVVLGGATARLRDNRMADLLEQYVPLASAGRKTARPVPGGLFSAPVVVASAVPLPHQRPTIDANATGSTVADATDDASATAADDTVAAAAVAAAPAEADASAAPTTVASLIGANSIFALDGTDAEGDTNADDETADAAPAASTHSGWRIQIAAAPTKEGAEDMLDQALAKAGSVLAKADPYTEPVQSGDSTLYRARFAGFSTKEKARAACAYLAKQKFSCLAVSD
ncbi:MAG TPA: D-alanyl-D-alanine carboxypeptidase [Bauldia sp.]|nr:D-alanyl-D-alanine carboxypeptidase [Bauldia sp.]